MYCVCSEHTSKVSILISSILIFYKLSCKVAHISTSVCGKGVKERNSKHRTGVMQKVSRDLEIKTHQLEMLPFSLTSCSYPDIRISRHKFNRKATSAWPHVQQKCSLTSQNPINTNVVLVWGTRVVFHLFGHGEKNSKFSTLQYSLHRSSLEAKRSKRGRSKRKS